MHLQVEPVIEFCFGTVEDLEWGETKNPLQALVHVAHVPGALSEAVSPQHPLGMLLHSSTQVKQPLQLLQLLTGADELHVMEKAGLER